MKRSLTAQGSYWHIRAGGTRIILTRCAKVSYKNGPGRATKAARTLQTARRDFQRTVVLPGHRVLAETGWAGAWPPKKQKSQTILTQTAKFPAFFRCSGLHFWW